MIRSLAFAITGLALAIGATACASVTLKDDDVVKRAGAALGLEPGQFTISDRTNEGLEARFKATTNAGKVYNCSMAVSVSALGSVPSDAICTPMGGGPTTTCNALLKAANKC